VVIGHPFNQKLNQLLDEDRVDGKRNQEDPHVDSVTIGSRLLLRGFGGTSTDARHSLAAKET